MSGPRMWHASPRIALGVLGLGAFVILGTDLPWFAQVDPSIWQSYPRNRVPSLEHWMGTTSLGQDIFWLLSWSIGNSLVLGVVVATFSTIIGVIVGLVAGFRGGWIDRALSFVMDVTIVVPSLPILILLASIVKGHASLISIAVILIVFNWPFPARQMRAVALSMREREFVHMAWFSGEGASAIIRWQIFPYLKTWVMANFINTILVSIAAETSLAVIGLSSADRPTLGTMIYWALKYQAVLAGRWWWIGAPVASSILLFVSLFLVATGLGQRSQEVRGL